MVFPSLELNLNVLCVYGVTLVTMEVLHFTEDDIREQLEAMGYQHIPQERLQEFARDLEKLVDHERSFASTSSSSTEYAAEIRSPLESNSPKMPYHHNLSKMPYHHNPSTMPYHHNPTTDYHCQYGKENEVSQPSYDQHAAATMAPSKGILRRNPKKPSITRKVMRKTNGEAQVFDESISDIGEMSAINERLDQLPLNDDVDVNGSYTETENDDTSSIMQDVFPRRPRSSRDLYSHRPAGDEEGVYKPHLPRSFIRPASAHVRWKQHNKKTDPVSRHQMYQTQWHSRKAPGEKNRNNLRWNIRERMMYKDDPIQARNQPRVYVPNSYQVPTEKKRQALRWAVRTVLAQQQIPQTSTFF